MKCENIGIDLGSYNIKIVTIKENADTFSIKNAETYRVDSKVESSEDYFVFLKDCIKNFTKKNKIMRASLNFNIPFDKNKSTVDIIDTPVVKNKILEKSIKYEIEEKEITDNIKSIYYKWDILDKGVKDDDNYYDIVIVTIKRNIVKELNKLRSLRWKINSIELQPITVGRLVQGDSVVVDFGHTSTRLYMYRDGKIDSVEEIDFSGSKINNIIRGMSNDGNDTDLKSRIFIVDEDILQDSIDEVVYECSTRVTQLVYDVVEEIKRTVRGFELKNNIMINKVYYIGEVSNILYFTETLSSELELDVSPLELITPVDGDEDMEDLKIYTIAGSGAIKDKYKYLPRLNFTSSIYGDMDIMPAIICLTCITITMNCMSYRIHKDIDGKIVEIKELRSTQESSIKSVQNDIDKAMSSKDKSERVISYIDELNNSKKWLSDIMFILPNTVTNEMVVTELDIKDGVVVVSGFAKNYSNIGFLAIELEKIGLVNIDTIDNDINKELYLDELPESGDNTKMERFFKMTFRYRNTLLNHDKVVQGV